MPVTTRLQARRALEAASNSLSPPPPQLSPSSPIPSPEPSPVPSSSPPHLGPITRSFGRLRARRRLSHVLHHFRGHSSRFSRLEGIYLSKLYIPELYIPEPHLAPEVTEQEDIDFSDYVSGDDDDYGFESPCPTCASATPDMSPSEESPLFFLDIGEELTGTKRQRSKSSSPLGVQTFLDSLPFGTSPTPRKYIKPTSRLSSSGTLKETTIEQSSQPKPTAGEVDEARRQQTIQRLRATYLVLHSHHSCSSSYPLLRTHEHPEMKTHFFAQHIPDPYHTISPVNPNWLVVRDVHWDWKGNLSPKVSSMGTNYIAEAVGKRRRLDNQLNKR